jgi:hypothetical protein
LFPSSNDGHLKDGQIIDIINGELASKDAAKAHSHLDSCWKCLARKEQLEGAIFRLVDYRRELLGPYLPPPADGEHRFIARLDRQIEALQRNWWSRFLSRIRSSCIPPLSQSSATIFAVAAAFVLVTLVWHHNLPTVSANAFLDKAIQSEAKPANAPVPGVIYQRIEIKTKTRKLERSIYRDATHKRTPRAVPLKPEEDLVRNELEIAGVDWQEPLSAVKFRQWHDRLASKTDHVKSDGSGISMLVTRTESAATRESSLAVRTADFHPIARRVLIGNSDEIEISEINYDVLSWDAVNVSSLFEEPAPAKGAPAALAMPASKPVVDDIETELAVRYALHEAGADLGEPIDVKTGAPGRASVVVVGIVASSERKQELLAALRDIPRVSVQLQTEEEAAQSPMPQDAPVKPAEPLIVGPHSLIEKELLQYFDDPLAVEKFSKRAIELTEVLLTRASALRTLSERFHTQRAEGESTSSLPFSPSERQLLQRMRRDHYRAMAEATNELTALLRPVLRSIIGFGPESVSRQPLFACARQAQQLTLALLSGKESGNINEPSEPANAARDLLNALRNLELSLEEEQ